MIGLIVIVAGWRAAGWRPWLDGPVGYTAALGTQAGPRGLLNIGHAANIPVLPGGPYARVLRLLPVTGRHGRPHRPARRPGHCRCSYGFRSVRGVMPLSFHFARRRRRLLATVPLAALVLVAAGCSSGSESAVTILDDSGASKGLRGTALPQPIDKPALNLTDTAGAPFDLRSRTAGKVTLLFFGYTHCPDVCPTTMADIAAALNVVPASVRAQVATVFVTTDPDRDTGVVLDQWLNQFDPSFVGVRGTLAQVHAQADALGIPLEEPVRQSNGMYTVTHGTQVMAFTKDNKASVLYLAGTQVADYVHDLPILADTGKTT